jgi:hypothetical protein
MHTQTNTNPSKSPAGTFPENAKPHRSLDKPRPSYAPTNDDLQLWVDEEKSDREIAHIVKDRTGRSVSERWVRDLRTANGIRRLVLTGARAKGRPDVIRDETFQTSGERDACFDRVRHGEWRLEDVESFTGCSYYDVKYEYEVWLRTNRRKPLQSGAQRAALTAIADPDATMVDRALAVMGRRMRITETGSAIVDGERVTISRAVELADQEARELGLPSITRKE